MTIYIDRDGRNGERAGYGTGRAASEGRKTVSLGAFLRKLARLTAKAPAQGHRRVLVVLFIPSVERDGVTPIDQGRWVNSALEMFGRVFGGATAFPKAKGIWRDDERGGTLVKDEPVVLHCYTTRADIEDDGKLSELAKFCRMMGREAHQGEVGLVIGDEYIAINDFTEEQ